MGPEFSLEFSRMSARSSFKPFDTLMVLLKEFFIPTANFVCGVYTVFTLSVRAWVRTSVTFCFLNILRSHCWIFIKPCKHVHICKVNNLNKKVRARGQFYESYFPL